MVDEDLPLLPGLEPVRPAASKQAEKPRRRPGNGKPDGRGRRKAERRDEENTQNPDATPPGTGAAEEHETGSDELETDAAGEAADDIDHTAGQRPEDYRPQPPDLSLRHLRELDVRTAAAGTQVWMQRAGNRIRGQVESVETDPAWAEMTKSWPHGAQDCNAALTIVWEDGRRWHMAYCPDCCGSGQVPVYTGPSYVPTTRLGPCLHCGGRGMHITRG